MDGEAIGEAVNVRVDLARWMSPKREQELRASLNSHGVKSIGAEGLRCADLLERWLGGLHHFPGRRVAKTCWDDFFVAVSFGQHQHLGSIDGDGLTRLLFLAHDLGIRVEVSGRGMNGFEVLLHPRVRDGGFSERHPTLEEAVAAWRERHQDLVAVGVRRG